MVENWIRTRALRRGALAIGVSALAIVVATPVVSAKATTVRTSVKAAAVQANGRSEEPSISTNGRLVTFDSNARNLVNGDTNGVDDCFVRDHVTKQTVRVSISTGGAQGNGTCTGPAISGSGRYVAFESAATNLDGGDGNGVRDIFVRDRTNGTTVRVSESSGGDEANGPSFDPAISEDGTRIVFESRASNLVPNDTNGVMDVFMHDLGSGQTTRVSVGNGEQQANRESGDPAISANGNVVVFESLANNLGAQDTNGKVDIYVRVLGAGSTSRVSVRSNGDQGRGVSGNPTVSGDGRYVAFDSFAANLVRGDTNRMPDVFVHDRASKKTKRVSVRNGGGQGNNWSFDPTISKNGRYISFTSSASNLVRGDTNRKWDGFVHDRVAKKTKRISLRTGGGQALGGDSDDFAISGDGRFVAFESQARNLVRNDTNNKKDVFRRGRLY
jgi:Tol biopolymer transport system component